VILDNPHPVGSTGMTEAILALTYDPSVLAVAEISLGSIPSLGAGWELSSVVDAATGQIGIELFSATPITATQAGSLVNVVFDVLPGRNVPATVVELVNRSMPNSQQFVTQVDDGGGQLTLSLGTDQREAKTAIKVRASRAARSLAGR
jgi:hypothetical protein